jgi:hypothetical protein
MNSHQSIVPFKSAAEIKNLNINLKALLLADQIDFKKIETLLKLGADPNLEIQILEDVVVEVSDMEGRSYESKTKGWVTKRPLDIINSPSAVKLFLKFGANPNLSPECPDCSEILVNVFQPCFYQAILDKKYDKAKALWSSRLIPFQPYYDTLHFIIDELDTDINLNSDLNKIIEWLIINSKDLNKPECGPFSLAVHKRFTIIIEKMLNLNLILLNNFKKKYPNIENKDVAEAFRSSYDSSIPKLNNLEQFYAVSRLIILMPCLTMDIAKVLLLSLYNINRGNGYGVTDNEVQVYKLCFQRLTPRENCTLIKEAFGKIYPFLLENTSFREDSYWEKYQYLSPAIFINKLTHLRKTNQITSGLIRAALSLACNYYNEFNCNNPELVRKIMDFCLKYNNSFAKYLPQISMFDKFRNDHIDELIKNIKFVFNDNKHEETCVVGSNYAF